MKILDAWVYDPTLEGRRSQPKLWVAVDEMPDVTIEPEPFAGGWEVGKFGPFVWYSKGDTVTTAGDFNVRFRNRFPPIVDIVLDARGEGYRSTSYYDYSLPLRRARQLVRKHSPEWRLLLSDRAAADSGLLLWLPVRQNEVCKHWQGDDVCGARPTRTIHVNGVDLALCEKHLKDHNEKHRMTRVKSH